VEAKELAYTAAKLSLTKKAQDVVVLDLTGLSDVTNFFVICNGESDTQVRAIADAVIDGTREAGAKVWRKEGVNNAQWVLLDFVDVVVHVFQPKIRQYYDIERLWGDAPLMRINDE
jgi:ribosome-associated protein